MGQRTKGSMWCEVDGPVLGVKNTHRIRNTGALAGSIVVPGAFLFGKVEAYYCPNCGLKVSPAWQRSMRRQSCRRRAGADCPLRPHESHSCHHRPLWARDHANVRHGLAV